MDADTGTPDPTDHAGGRPGHRSVAGRRRNAGHLVRRLLRYALLVAAAVVVAFPIYITVVNALLSPQQIAARPPTLFPVHPQWGAFSSAFSLGNLGIFLRNSLLVTVAITAAEVATSALAGYAFAFIRFPFSRTVFVLFLATLMIPMEVTLVPNRETIVALGWFNSFPALIVPFLASGFGTFLFRQSFRGVPRDLHDAARLDGYGHWRFLTRVVLPLNRPVIGAFTVFAFLGAWNQYLWPLIVTETNGVRTVQIGLRQLQALSINQTNVIFAGTVLAALPIFVILIVFQKQLVRGLTAGAVKG
jgi:sn-glycerol 3-phosphate transport system permease protein